MSKSKEEAKSEFVKECISKDESAGYVYSESAKQAFRKAYDEADLTSKILNNRQQEISIESQRINNIEREKGLLLLRIEHARRNIDVLSKLRTANGYELEKISKEVLDALKVNVDILNEVKNIK